MNGIEKARQGTKALLNFVKSKNINDLDLVNGCFKELKFWVLLMHFCNNMDYLFQDISDIVLKDIFNVKELKRVTDIFDDTKAVVFDYGEGFKSNISGKYTTQLRFIRNALAHGTFTFDGKMIHINNCNNGYEAIFDYQWFETLTLCALANSNHLIKKGLEDYEIFMLANADNLVAKDIPFLSENNMIHCLKVTCIAEDKKTVLEKIPSLSTFGDRLNFSQIRLSFIKLLNDVTKKYCKYLSLEEAFKKALTNLKEAYKGILKIEVMDINEYIVQEPDFNELPLLDAMDYLVNAISSNDKTTKNTIDLKKIFLLLDKIESGKVINKGEIYSFQDTEQYLLNLYGYIFFASKIYDNYNKDIEHVFNAFAPLIKYRYVHAKNVWGEYCKRINKGINALKVANEPLAHIKMWEERLKIYQSRLNRIGSADFSLFNNFRNSLTHGLVEYAGENIIFYGQEPEIKIPKINSKTQKLIEVPFRNKDHTFEIVIDKNNYLVFLDNLYSVCNFEINNSNSRRRECKYE